MIVIKKFVSLTMAATKTGAKHFTYHRNGCWEEKSLLWIHTTAEKLNWLDKHQARKSHNLKNYISRKKGAKVKNHILLRFMTAFHNFALKKKSVELKGWLSPYCWYICWFIHSRMESFKKILCNKINCKCSKFTIKTKTNQTKDKSHYIVAL